MNCVTGHNNQLQDRMTSNWVHISLGKEVKYSVLQATGIRITQATDARGQLLE
jgi:hypothetical protein